MKVRIQTVAWVAGLAAGASNLGAYLMVPEGELLGEWYLLASGLGFGMGLVAFLCDYRELWPKSPHLGGGESCVSCWTHEATVGALCRPCFDKRAAWMERQRKTEEDVRADRIARDAEVARRIRGVNATPGSINSGYDKSHSIKDDPEHRRGGCCEAHSPGSTEWKAQQRTTEDGEKQ